MKILPPNVAQQIARVDRQKSLAIAIGSGLTALWCAYRVFWALYLSMTYSFVFGSLIFPVVLWGVIGVAAGVYPASRAARPSPADARRSEGPPCPTPTPSAAPPP